MANNGETKLSAHSAAIAKRLKGIKGLTGDAKESGREFITSDAKLQTLSARAGAAEAARDAAIEKVIALDVTRDQLVLDVGDALVGAKLGDRMNPFKGVSKHTPAKMVRLAYAKQSVAVAELDKAVRAKKPPATILKLLGALAKASAQVDQALDAMDKPNRAYQEAFAARDAALPDWQKALTALRVQLKAALAKRPGAYAALFAKPDGAQRAMKRKKPVKTSAAATTTTPAT